MLHKQTEARLVRSIGVGCWTALGAYLAHALYNQFGSANDSLMSPMTLTAIGLLLAFMLAGFYTMYMNVKASEFFIDVETEARKVHWPDWLTVKGSTGQVIVVMIFLMLYLFVVDFVFGYIRQAVL